MSACIDALATAATPPHDDDRGNKSRNSAWPAGRIEHCQHVLQRDLARLGAAGGGIVASVQPLHMASDAATSERVLGQWRRHGAFPLATLLRQHRVPLACGSDWPVVPAHVGRGLHAAVTRRAHCAELARTGARADAVPSGAREWEARQRLTLREALAAYTSVAAAAGGDDALFGRTAPGLLADLVLLSPKATALLLAQQRRAAAGAGAGAGAGAVGDADEATDFLAADDGFVLRTFFGGRQVFPEPLA